MRYLFLAPLLACASPAQAAHCPHGQIYMVHTGQCMARASFHEAIRHRATPAVLQRREEVPSHEGITYVHVIQPDPVGKCEAWVPATTGWPMSWLETRGLQPHDRWLIGTKARWF